MVTSHLISKLRTSRVLYDYVYELIQNWVIIDAACFITSQSNCKGNSELKGQRKNYLKQSELKMFILFKSTFFAFLCLRHFCPYSFVSESI